ncbi:AMP-binding protein [Streptomyces sp. DT2A-34]|uniref:AMP-binding protein n=1 Tax=Streptomyces sp. DT2A-34 TaxID=3051182 RepID=UPI003463AFC6
MTGGSLDARMLLPWFDRHPESLCRLVNMFGITGTTVHVTEQTLTRRLALAATRSVGRAGPGWHLYVTDPAGRLLPPGVAGDICVGGAGVALGYFGQEELTARRFVPAPSPTAPRTAAATWDASARTAASNTSGGSTARSRSAASGSSWRRSARSCWRTRMCGRQP